LTRQFPDGRNAKLLIAIEIYVMLDSGRDLLGIASPEGDMSGSFNQFRLERRSSAYWRVTFDHPPINLFDDNTVPELERLLDLAEAEPDLKVIVFDSANPDFFIAHFSPGAGYKNLTTRKPSGHFPWTEICLRLANLPAVSIAAVRGRARGGGSEFALACDIRFASRERAVFAQLEVGTGLLAIGGAIERLPQLMGRGRALEALLGRDDFDADLAERYGWINRAIPDAEFEPFVEAFAQRVASFDGQSIRETKRLVTLHDRGPTPADFDESAGVFYSQQWPGTASRFPKLIELGSGKPSDLELNFGQRLGTLWRETWTIDATTTNLSTPDRRHRAPTRQRTSP
jgi:enoyl-CoA hydratase/carnithine racemase